MSENTWLKKTPGPTPFAGMPTPPPDKKKRRAKAAAAEEPETSDAPVDTHTDAHAPENDTSTYASGLGAAPGTGIASSWADAMEKMSGGGSNADAQRLAQHAAEYMTRPPPRH